MKNIPLVIYGLFFAALIHVHAQKKKLENPFETKGDLNSQFIYLEKTSTNYKEYKVITKAKFLELHKNVLDSMKIERAKLKQQQTKNQEQLTEINNLTTELKGINNELIEANTNKDSISVFGISMVKSNYNLVAGIIILSLLATTLLFFYKFTNSNTVTKEAKNQLEETQNEFEAHQRNSLRKLQEVSRKLQDEIIKNRKE